MKTTITTLIAATGLLALGACADLAMTSDEWHAYNQAQCPDGTEWNGHLTTTVAGAGFPQCEPYSESSRDGWLDEAAD